MPESRAIEKPSVVTAEALFVANTAFRWKEITMKFINLGLKPKIMSGSILPVLVCILIGIAGIWTLHILTNILLSTDRGVQLGRHILEVERSAAEVESGVHEYLLSGSNKALERYNTARATLSGDLTAMKGALGSDQEAIRAIDDAAKSVGRWQAEFAQPLFERRKGMSDSQAIREVNELVSSLRVEKSLDNLRNIMTTFKKKTDGLIAQQIGYGVRAANFMTDLVVYGLTVSTLLALAISYFLASGITRRLMDAVTFSESISEGDLARTLDARSSDEVGRLGASLNAMVSNLKEQIRRILEAVNVLTSSAAEVAATATQLATSGSSTSAAVAETSTTVEQVKQAARLANEKAKGVAESSKEAVQVSEAGKQATEGTIDKITLIREQMGSIGEAVVTLSEQSQAIEGIIATVQDLADQSNLLAVNASIEAARAGDQGKGFAVVAQEIKSLADQSRDATEQIRVILEGTRKWVSAVVMATEQGSKAVQAGVDQSQEAGNAISRLSSSVAASAQSALVIQTSSEQQAVGMDQVSGAMANIDAAMRQATDSTGQLESAAQRLTDLGGNLKELVHQYRV
ncbi:MAG: methyl-accepting chemotaxis protein [Desulfomonile tiedjei]|nr:methyl-accepting chemotaxis protein [Desulfomonile tiedjei]